MDFSVIKVAADKQRASCILVGIYEGRRLSPAAQAINDASGGELTKLIRSFGTTGALGQTVALNNVPNIPSKQIVLVGCGKKGAMTASQYRRVLTAGIRDLNESGFKDATLCVAELEVESQDIYWKVRQSVESVRETAYRFNQLKSEANATKKPALTRVVCAIPSQRGKSRAEQGMTDAIGIADGVDLAMDLGNLPGNVCTPTYLGAGAKIGTHPQVHQSPRAWRA